MNGTRSTHEKKEGMNKKLQSENAESKINSEARGVEAG